MRRLADLDAATELTQEVFVVAWRRRRAALEVFDPDTGELLASEWVEFDTTSN